MGGGLVGISCAYFLQKEGFNIAVIEADRICQGTTAHTTAKITSQHGLIYNKIKNQRGKDMAKVYAESNELAIIEYKRIIDENKIDCDYTHQSAYIYTQDDKYVQKIKEEVKTARDLGIEASYIEEIPFPIPIKGAIRLTSKPNSIPENTARIG